MLDELVVINLGVLADVSITPSAGLTVVTGETGAGKTLLVGALTALGAGRLDQSKIGPAGDEVSVSARLVRGDEVRVVRASLSKGGRTRSYVDGAAATVAEVASVIEGSVDVVAQHDGLALRREGAVRALLDQCLGPAGREAWDAHRLAWEALTETRRRMSAIGGDPRAVRREAELARHEAEEIGASRVEVGEEEELAGRIGRLSNAEALAERVAELDAALERAEGAIGETVESVRRIARLDESTELTADGVAAELADLVRAARDYRDELEHDPAELAVAQERLATIGDLKRRYGATIEEVIAYGKAAAARADELLSMVDDADRLGGLEEAQARDAAATAAALTHARRIAADGLAERATGHLRELGFTDPVLAFTREPADVSATGADRWGLTFASDRRLESGPLAVTASGGELSRAVLALRLAAGVGSSPVVVFDEVDAGVGGATALALGAKLAGVATDAQVLCVTHLPQVAAHADTHLVVDRVGATATVREVVGDERLVEITRMLSGLSSEQGRQHAAELLMAAGKG